MKNVAIIDGIAEGTWNTKILRAALVKAGYKVTDIIENADIIVAHSAGCFYLPRSNNTQLILLIGPPYWPGRPLIISVVLKIYKDLIYRIRDRKIGFWLLKNYWSFLYLFVDIVRSVHIGIYARRRDFHTRLPNKKLILIRNEDDAWCTPKLEEIPFGDNDVMFYRLPGEHDDCWIHPEPYIDIIKANS